MCFPMEYCCCCIRLDVGAKIISVLGLVLSLCLAVLYTLPVLLMLLPYNKLLVYSGMASAFGLQTVFGCFHIYGVFGKKPAYIWPWIVVAWTQSVLLMAASIIGTSIIITSRRFELSDEINIVISAFVIYSMVLFYFASVSNSHRIGLQRRKKEEEVTKRLMRSRPPPAPNAWKYRNRVSQRRKATVLPCDYGGGQFDYD